jgi:hypothetical protein
MVGAAFAAAGATSAARRIASPVAPRGASRPSLRVSAFSPPAAAAHKPPRAVLRPPARLRLAPAVAAPARAQLSPFNSSSADTPDALRDVPEPVLRAVERLARQPRVTVPDVAAAAGIDIPAAQDSLVTLASVTGAAIDVSEAGELAYRFPRNVRQVLRQRSVRSALRMAWDKAFPALFTAVRVSFGAFLVLSIVLTFIAVVALSASAKSENESDGRRSRGGGGNFFFGPRLFGPDIFDVMFYSRRMGGGARVDRGRGGRQRPDEQELSFLESIYSFVFGDGDPNAERLQRRWRKVAAVIRAGDGCVAAEQVAPFLDLPADYAPDRRRAAVDEGFMLPVLQRFHGHPEVTEDGDLVYVFPDFGVTGSTTGGAGSVDVVGAGSTAALRESELKLSGASKQQQLIAGVLGAVNLGGVVTLGSMLSSAVPATVDSAALLSAARAFYPALFAYALTFVAVPALRAFWQRGVNARIRARNGARASSWWRPAGAPSATRWSAPTAWSSSATGRLATSRGWSARRREALTGSCASGRTGRTEGPPAPHGRSKPDPPRL